MATLILQISQGDNFPDIRIKDNSGNDEFWGI